MKKALILRNKPCFINKSNLMSIRKLILTTLSVSIFLLVSVESTSQHKCNTQTLHVKKMSTDANYASQYRAFEKSLSLKLKDINPLEKADCANPVFFPVAIHYDWVPSEADQAELIKLAQNQIATLNTAFNGNDCQGTSNSNCFEFFLATHDHPSGSGLAEGSPAVTFGGTVGEDYCATEDGATTPCNLSRWVGYMNITVNSLSDGKECEDLGVSELPGNPTTKNSMSVNSCAFGSIGVVSGVDNVLGSSKCDCLANSVNGGTTVVHEIGHFVGLFHTFCADIADNGANGSDPQGSLADGENCQQPSVCDGGCQTTACDCDLVSDTPPQAFSNNGCPGGSASGTVANPSDPGNSSEFNNFMDYVDDACMNCFSQGQYARVAATLATDDAGVANYKSKSQVSEPGMVVCSISGISASSITCSGDNATASISFTAANGSGTIEVLDGSTVIGSGESSPISVTISGPTTVGSKTLTVRYANDTACSGSASVSIPTCPQVITPPDEVETIPTMGEWFIILLGISFFILTVLAYQKKAALDKE